MASWGTADGIESRPDMESATVSTMKSSFAHHDDEAATAAAVADRRQAEVFWRELHERLEQLTATIASHSRRMAHHQNHKEFTAAGRMRRILREAEREHYTVQRLIGRLHDRFPDLQRQPAPNHHRAHADVVARAPHHRIG